ncbi:zinc ribbon domain-containing protein, partial [Frankia sp. CN7]|uniref:zinc ribbon domain-containing protein n=1 Tax=Frankia nepalensis TaxID=1836974 RepID=UPI001931B480
MSAAFDGSGYRRRVLAVLRARSPLRIDDPFFVADLDPEGAYTDAEVQAKLARVLAFLQRERSSAKYATLAAELVGRRAEWEAPLRDAATRERIRARVALARRDGEAERLAKVDGYLATVRERFGGVPASRVDGLRRLAAQAGVSGERFDARLARERIIDDATGAGVAPLPADVRGQIRDRLEELRALRRGDHASTASLWAFLGVAPDASPAQLAAAYEAVAAVNARRGHDREKTVTADLLALVRARLIEADPAAYTAGLLADAAQELRGAVEEHVLLDGEITAVAFEGLMRQALGAGRGLSVAQVRSVVLGLARDLGVPVSTPTSVDFVLCPACGRPEPVGEVRVCRYCDTDLYIGCPSCGRLTEAAAVVCRHCGQSVRQSRDATEALAAIRRALDDGCPAEAADLVGRARPLLVAVGGPTLAAGEELAAHASAALAAADAGWRALADDRAAGRAEAALERARWLVAQAADVPGPDGRSASEVLEELTVAQAMIRRRVDAALALPIAAREAALVAVLASAADSPEALAALNALPLAPPMDLAAFPVGGAAAAATGAVLLRWRVADAAAPVSFRVDRVVASTLGAPPARSSLGVTTSPELTDAGAPAWAPVYYEVTAVSGSRRSAVARTVPLVLTREVDLLGAQQTDEGVRLTWRLDGPVQVVTVERAVEAVDPMDADEDGADPAGGPPTGGLALPSARDVDRSVRHTRVSGGQLVDPDVQPGVTYRYRLSVEYVTADGTPARTAGVEVSVAVVARPRPVLDLSVAFAAGETMLRWTAPPGSDVRIYATPGVLPDLGAAAAGRFTGPSAGPFGPESVDLPLGAVTESSRLVGTSRRGRLLDSAAAGPVIYTPVSMLGGHGVVGRPVQHVAPGGVTELRAEDRGDELVLYFRLAPGLSEARVLWRRDRMPTGPDDPTASAATVTTAGLELRGGGWRLAAPRDGWPYYVACFPIFRVAGQPRAAAAGAELVARAPAMPPSTDPAAPGTGPMAAAGASAAATSSYLTSPVTGGLPTPSITGGVAVAPATGALPLPPAAASAPPAGQPPAGQAGLPRRPPPRTPSTLPPASSGPLPMPAASPVPQMPLAPPPQPVPPPLAPPPMAMPPAGPAAAMPPVGPGPVVPAGSEAAPAPRDPTAPMPLVRPLPPMMSPPAAVGPLVAGRTTSQIADLPGRRRRCGRALN